MDKFFIFILLVIFITLLLADLYIEKQKHLPVDMVFTWYSENESMSHDKEYYKRGKIREDAVIKERYSDINELKYAILSTKKHAQFINKIFVVVADDQHLPDWLINDQDVEIVRHSIIFNKNQVNPTYNSVNIESSLHNIPNLSELFIYSNDDMFFNRDVHRGMFFRGNTPVVWMERERGKMYLGTRPAYTKIHDIMERNALALSLIILKENGIMPTHPELLNARLKHQYKSLTKSICRQFEILAGDRLMATHRSRFRDDNCVYFISGASNFGLQTGKMVSGDIPVHYFVNLNQIPQEIKIKYLESWINYLNPYFVCLNNGVRGRDDDVEEMLKRKFEGLDGGR